MNNNLNAMTFYQAGCAGYADNTLYPNRITVSDAQTLSRVIENDYVCVQYRANHRSSKDFIVSDCIGGDIDNDHSDNREDWVTPEDVHMAFPNVPMAIHYSRHNNKPKEGRSARPRFHVIMRCKPQTDAQAYAGMKKRMMSLFPYFDDNAMDAARFFFGTPGGRCEFYPGSITLDEFLASEEDPFAGMDSGRPIPEGCRNTTMHRIAVRLLKRLGDTDECREQYLKLAAACTPPLDDQELGRIWQSALRFYNGQIVKDENYIPPEKYGKDTEWEDPIPFTAGTVLPFPVDALPKPFADFAAAVAQSTQTPVDMAACCMLAIMSTCLQGKYEILGKADWKEQLNLYVEIIAKPSERKSAVLNACLKPLNQYEKRYNRQHAAEVESCRLRKRALERRVKTVEEKVAKGNADESELEHIAREISEFCEKKPLQLYVDDITTEKLVSVLAENNSKTALISSEGGIFDMLAGTYGKNVNIDVMLKAYSGGTIRVDRIGRESQSVMDPSLSVLLMAQPTVVAEVLNNKTFRGRGLVGRFLFSDPVSTVGSRDFDSQPVPEEVREVYDRFVTDMLDDTAVHEEITLAPEAARMLSDFAYEIEKKMNTEFAEMSDWAGKIVGNTLRIAGLISRGSQERAVDFLDDIGPLVVDGTAMRNALRISRYFQSHAQHVFSCIPTSSMTNRAETVLRMLVKQHFREFNRRDAMRKCRSFKTVDEVQPVLDFLEAYGYICRKETAVYPSKGGRPVLPEYTVHPRIGDYVRDNDETASKN